MAALDVISGRKEPRSLAIPDAPGQPKRTWQPRAARTRLPTPRTYPQPAGNGLKSALFPMETVWPRCLERLEAEFSAEDVHTWLKPLQASAQADGLVLYAPNAFVVDTVRERYLERIRELIDHYAGLPTQVTLAVGSSAREPAPTPAASAAITRAPVEFHGNLDKHYTFDNFVEGRSNQLGRAAALQVALNPGRDYNPLLLYGGTGLGKTHLMYAAGNLMRANNPGMRVLYLRSEQFSSAMMKPLQEKSMPQPQRQFP